MHKKPKTQQILSPLTWTDLYEKEFIALSKRITELRRILRKWDQSHDEVQDIAKTDEGLMRMYLQKIATYTSETRYNEFRQHRNIHDQMIKELDDIEQAYINYNMFDEAKWTLIFTEETAQEIEDLVKGEENLKILFTRLCLYLQGYIPINNSLTSNQKFLTEIESSKQASCRYFLEIHHDFSLFLSIGYEKLPKIEYQKNSANTMIYTPFIQVIKVFPDEPDKKQLDELLKRSEELYKNSPSKNLSEEKLEDDVQAKEKLGKKIHFFNYEKQSEDQEENEIVQKRHPLIFKQRKCTEEQEYQEYMFALKSYQEAKQNLDKKQDFENRQDQIKKAQRLAIFQNLKQFFSFTSSSQLIKVYEQIPNKKYKLTEDEKSIVTFDSNMIVIGRSGTGKTLCALLRLFVIQFFFKARETLRTCTEKRPLQASDLDRVVGLKNVFLTASPYLIKEIKKQYDEMIEHIKAILMENSEKRKAKKLQNGEILNEQEEDFTYETKLFKDELENATLDDLIEQFEEKIQRMNCLNDLNEKDFPGFFSIRKFVQMIDGTLQHPMLYEKNSEDKAKDEDEETKQSQQEQKPISKPEQSKEEMQMQMQQKQEQQVGWMEEEENKNEEAKLQEKTKKEERKVEVTYQVFALEFWPEVPKSYFKVQKQLTPSNIWSEVYSVIKGSYMSHKSHTKYLSKTQYLSRTKKEMTEQYEYKKVVYQIFQYYENWKQKTSHYDFMDLVNHILSDISVYGYQGPMINYLFVDQVQDLPPATMYLVSKIVTNGVFYCGDSAQTIAKGVNFKFGDIPQMFHDKFKLEKIDLPSPENQQLVVNFRSHNQILQLGHSVITIIEKLFPGSIDKLKSQSSSFRGPVPMLLSEMNQVKLLSILTPEIKNVANIDRDYLDQYKRNVPDGKIFKLGPEQIILVRNEEQKNLLPFRLKQGVVLTFEDVKGLEYDDVVLVNFFSSSRYLDKWRLLKCLEVEIEQVKKQEYEARLKSRQDVKGHHLQDDKSITRTFNWDDNMPNLVERNGKFYYQVPKITYCRDIKGENIKEFYELLTELKILYTAITRARKNFIIYEQHIPKNLERLWLKLRFIRPINNQNYETIKDELHQYRRIHKNKSFQNQEKTWIKEGFKWFIRKNYEQAIRCFINANDMKTARRIEAEMIANQAAAQMRRVRNQLKNPDNLPKEQFKIKRKMVESSKSKINEKFIKAGKIFEEVQRIKNAGECYYSGQDYERAFQCFKKSNSSRGCAECSEALKLYEEAGDYYEKLGKYEKMLQCYDKSQNLKKVQEKLIKHLTELTQSEETCIKYGKLILRFKVQNYLDSNEWLKVQWKKNNIPRYSYSPTLQIKKNISRYFYAESIQNLSNVIQVKVKLQNFNKKILQLKQQIETWHQQLYQADRQFQILKPYKNLKKGEQLYQLYMLEPKGKSKLFSQACYQDSLKYDDAIQLAQNYKSAKQTIYRNNKEIADLNDQLNKSTKQLKFIQAERGTIEQIGYLLQKLQKVYQQNQKLGANLGQKVQSKFINTKQIQNFQKKTKQNSTKNAYKRYDNEDFEVISILDQSFQSQYMSQSGLFDQDGSFSIQNAHSFKNSFKSVIFNFSINRQQVNNVILQAKEILDKIKNHVEYPLKPPFGEQHHLIVDSKMQSIITKRYPQFNDTIKFLRFIERIGEDHLALFTCEFYQLYDLAKRFIVSKIVKLNKMHQKSKKLTKAPFIQNNKQSETKTEVGQFLNQISPDFFNTECFRTLSSKQKILNAVIDTLLMQGLYKNALQYVGPGSDQKIQIAYAFLDYKELYEGLMEKISKGIQYKYKDQYWFLSEKKYGRQAKMLNQSSIQEIFFLYDSIQQNPFLTETNWKDSVKLNDHQTTQISRKVNTQMKNKENTIKRQKKQLDAKKRYFNSELPQKQWQQTQNKNILLEEAHKKQNQKIQQISEHDKIISECQKQIQILMNNIIPQLRKEHRQKDKISLTKRNQLNSLRQINKMLKPKQTQLIWENKCRFYELSCFVDWSKKWNVNLDPKIPYDLNPQIEIYFNVKERQEDVSNQVSQLDDQLRKISKDILSKEKQIPQTRQRRDMYRQSNQSYMFERNSLKEKILKLEDLPQTQQRQSSELKEQIIKLEKEIKKAEAQLDKFQAYVRNRQFKIFQGEQIIKNKQKYRQKILKKLKNCTQIPDEYKDGYFKTFMELREDKLSSQSQTITFKQNLKKCIDNSNRNLSELSAFEQCEMVVLYFSIICYPQKNDIFQYLKNQKASEFSHQKQEIRREIRRYERAIDDINYLKDKSQGGYYQGIQQRQIQAYKQHIRKLQYKHNNIGYSTAQVSSTFDKLKMMLEKMLKMTDSLSEQTDLWFIELMLGFFQCRVIRKCPSLWFLDSEYVIVKASSILVKVLLSKDLKNVFCYYIDDNKEFVILRFNNAYLTMKDLIRKKHKDFLYNRSMVMKDWDFKNEYFALKEVKRYYIGKDIRDFGKPKNDPNGKNIALLSNSLDLKDEIVENYHKFTNKTIQRKIQLHKEQVLRYYYENGFKTAQTFHFLQHQLKVLDESFNILLQCDQFSNLIMNDLSKKMDSLKEQFSKWKTFIIQQKEITGKSCEDDQEQEQK